MKNRMGGRREGFALVDVVILAAVLGLVGAVPVVGVVRSRIAANESATIGDVRTVMSAQSAYQGANGGWYERDWRCLAARGGCIPSSPITTPSFLDSQLASLNPRTGYARNVPTVGPAPAVIDPTVSASSVTAYSYAASPQQPGQTGVRGFGGDSRGMTCYSSDGSQPPSASGLLTAGPNCRPLK